MATISERLAGFRLRRLFRGRMRAAAARSGEPRFFPLGPDPSAESYFVTRTRREQRSEDFDALGCHGPEEIEARLRELWRDHPQLARLAPDFAALAALVRSREQDTDEVDPFVYVMY